MKLKQNTLVDIIDEQTRRALWEVKNVIDCVPDDLGDFSDLLKESIKIYVKISTIDQE
ncbi:MAG TPA: hypothetical protein H9765_09055 [Candidatus Mediterraneibacter intestinigallinarum]|nr:hypothetical protein [Candidatus Mediterraneibacter intestinigallinarum]